MNIEHRTSNFEHRTLNVQRSTLNAQRHTDRFRAFGVWLVLLSLTLNLAAAEIHEAAEQGDLAKVKTLVAANPACVNEREREQKTPLHFAAANGRLEVVEFLLANNAEINARSSSGITPLYLAKGFGHSTVAALLVKNGGTAEIVKSQKTAPVRPPVKKAPLTPVTPVLSPTPVRPIRLTIPILEAARTNGVAALEAILTAHPEALKVTDTNQWTALHHAVEQGHKAAVEFLLRAGAPVDARAMGEVTPLHIAVQRNNREMAALLITNKAEINARTYIQATPLLLAAAEGKAMEMVKLLLQAGADSKARDKYGNSALILAAALPEPDGVAELLLQAGAEVNAQENSSGFAALHHAVILGKRALVEALLAQQANPSLPLADGETPLSLALFEDRREIADLLRKNGATLPPEKPLTPVESSLVDHYRRFHQALASGSFEELRKLQQEAAPTQAEVNRLFIRGSQTAWELVERLRRDETVAWGAAARSPEDRQNMVNMLRNGARAGEYLRLVPLAPSPAVLSARAGKMINPELPAYRLEIKRRGGESIVVGDYFQVGNRWVIMPALTRVFPELARQ